jgi:hypothetical protein
MTITGSEHHSQHKQIMSVLIKWVEMGPSKTCIRLKYPCGYGADNYNPICPGINGETSNANRSLFASPAS